MYFKYITLTLVAISLSACEPQAPRLSLADQARSICFGNGFRAGTNAFNQCFNSSFQQLSVSDNARRQAYDKMAADGLKMAFPPPPPFQPIMNAPCIMQYGVCR